MADPAALWVDPPDIASRDLFHGACEGFDLDPAAAREYFFVARKTGGFSRGFDVRDAAGLEWSVKLGPEAQTEVVASRLVWAVGYHQPPTYYVPRWRLADGPSVGPQPPGRFRPKLPRLRKTGTWDWRTNPFTGTRPLRGLLVLMLMINNSDLKPENNAIYEWAEPLGGVRQWFVVRDLGHSFGRTGKLNGTRNDPDGFDEHGFIERVEHGRIRFEYHGFHRDLLDQIAPADVRWISERLARLSDRQWNDAFRAGGYTPQQAHRFIRRLQEKITAARARGIMTASSVRPAAASQTT